MQRGMSLFAAAIMMALNACGSGAGTPAGPSVRPAPAAPTGPAASAELAPDRVEANQLLVRRAAVDVIVDDVARAAARARAVLVGAGGYVERAQRSDRAASLTLRVPAASLDAVLDSLATLGRVASRTVSAEDVTAESIDLDARLQALIATRDRLRELQQRASTVADVIAVQRELGQVQGEVDSLEGRLKHLRGSAALANVELSVRQKVILGPLGVVAQALGTVLAKLFVIR